MKKTIFVLLSFILLYGSCKNKPVKGPNGITYHSAVEYNDYIVGRQTTLMKNIMSFVDVAQTNLDSAEALLDKYVRQTGVMVEEIKGMPAFKGDTALRNAAVDIFAFYQRIFDKDYRSIIQIRRGSDGASDEANAEIEQIVKRIEEEEKNYDDRFQGAQKNFARKNKMQLMENEMQKEFDEKMKTEE